MTSPDKLADENFGWLRDNPYPGRGIVAGLSETGQHLVQVYWIMGRSENSRNRVFKKDDGTGRLYTAPADPAKVKDPSLIIYNAMLEQGSHYVVSNGDQTDTVLEGYKVPFYLQEALSDREYEPDEPNFTQRITATSRLHKFGPFIQISILRRSLFNSSCDSAAYLYRGLRAGFGFCVTTYSGDGNPLPPFRGEPLLMPLQGDSESVAEEYWLALNEQNRVSLAVKFIEIGNGRSDIKIWNKYQEVA